MVVEPSSFSSTGTPAIFLHPVEAAHGDVGMLVRGDLLLAISKSGESAELESLMPVLGRLGIPVIALTAEPQSKLANRANLALDVGVQVEACPHDLAPTASSTGRGGSAMLPRPGSAARARAQASTAPVRMLLAHTEVGAASASR